MYYHLIKFQYFKAESRIGSKVRELDHIEKVQDMEENILGTLDRCKLTLDEIIQAKRFVESHGKQVMCTPFCISSLDDLLKIGFKLTPVRLEQTSATLLIVTNSSSGPTLIISLLRFF